MVMRKSVAVKQLLLAVVTAATGQKLQNGDVVRTVQELYAMLVVCIMLSSPERLEVANRAVEMVQIFDQKVSVKQGHRRCLHSIRGQTYGHWPVCTSFLDTLLHDYPRYCFCLALGSGITFGHIFDENFGDMLV